MSLGTEDDDADLKKALKLSLEEDGNDPALQRAIAMSLPSGSKLRREQEKTVETSSSVSYQTSCTTLSESPSTILPGSV